MLWPCNTVFPFSIDFACKVFSQLFLFYFRDWIQLIGNMDLCLGQLFKVLPLGGSGGPEKDLCCVSCWCLSFTQCLRVFAWYLSTVLLQVLQLLSPPLVQGPLV